MATGNYDQVVTNFNGKYVRTNWYDEEKYIAELKDYIETTYNKHYVGSKFQSLDAIIESGNGTGFLMGNIQKYAWRYGKKDGYNRVDLLKILHYGIIMLFCHDRNARDETTGEQSVGTAS